MWWLGLAKLDSRYKFRGWQLGAPLHVDLGNDWAPIMHVDATYVFERTSHKADLFLSLFHDSSMSFRLG